MRGCPATRLVLTIVLLLIAGCTYNVPGRLVPATSPIDDYRRINVVGKEARGESCQWWVSANIPTIGAFNLPTPMEGNQNYLALRQALEGKYDGLIGATTDGRITPYGIGFPISPSANVLDWAHVFVVSYCQEIRGKPFVYTEPLTGQPAR